MSLTLKWTIYYIAALLAIIGLHATLFYIADDEEPLFAFFALALMEGVMIVLTLVFQLAIILANLFSQKVRLRFLTAFSCLYAVIATGAYVALVYMLKSINAMNQYLGEEAEAFSSSMPHPYLHLHLLLLILPVLQIIIFVMYYRKNKKAKIANEHGYTPENQAPAA